MNRFGYTKMYDAAFYEKNREAIEEDSKFLLLCLNTSRLAIFTDRGNCHFLKMKDIPLCRLKDKGVPIDNVTNFDSASENILKIETCENLKDKTLLFVTSHAMIKRVEASEFESVKKSISATKLMDGDLLIHVDEIVGKQTVLVSEARYVLRFRNEDISLLKKSSVGVRGMKLGDGDVIAHVYDFDPSVKYVVKIGNKRVNLADLKLKKRDAKPDLIK